VLPQAIRRKMNLRAGDRLEARIEGERIVLIPSRKGLAGAVIKDPLTGLPCFERWPGRSKTYKQASGGDSCRFSMKYLLDVNVLVRSVCERT